MADADTIDVRVDLSAAEANVLWQLTIAAGLLELLTKLTTDEIRLAIGDDAADIAIQALGRLRFAYQARARIDPAKLPERTAWIEHQPDPADDPDYQAFLDRCADVCQCWPMHHRPCAGVTAGGLCDRLGDDDEPTDDDPEVDEQ